MEVESKKGDLSNEAITRVFEFRETLNLQKKGGEESKKQDIGFISDPDVCREDDADDASSVGPAVARGDLF